MKPKKSDEPVPLISPKMAKALANPWRTRILMELHVRPMSPSEFTGETGGDLSTIARYFRQLARWGFLEVREELRGGHRRGGVEHVYRAITRARFDTPTWEKFPRFLRNECTASVLNGYFRRIKQAIDGDTLDAELDRHLSWKAMPLDRSTWTELVTGLDAVLDWIEELEVVAARRLAETDEEPIPTTVGLAGFRSPKPGRGGGKEPST